MIYLQNSKIFYFTMDYGKNWFKFVQLDFRK